MSFEKRGKLEKDAQIMIKMLQQQESQIAKFKLLKLKNKKEDVSRYGLNSSVTFDYNDNEGRFAKAKKGIQIGEEILVENPHCAMLLEKFSKTHCQHCFKRYVRVCSNNFLVRKEGGIITCPTVSEPSIILYF